MIFRRFLTYCLLGLLAVGWAGLSVGHAAKDKSAARSKKAAASLDSAGSSHDASDKHEHDAFEEFQDSYVWTFFKNALIYLEFELPRWEIRIGNYVISEGLSKFMILELIAAGLVAAIYIPLARRLQQGEAPQGAWDNAFEAVLTFLRNDVARPNIGEHDADKYVPFLWTLFLFILFCNLLGMIPFMGSPTANLYVTGGLAIICFFALHGCAMAKMGFISYVKSLWPHMHVPFGMGFVLKPMIMVLELLGTFIKSFVLAVRLFANMFAGHTVLAMILGFIIMAKGAHIALWATVTGSSVLGVVALSLLELFVAFLQAYIFVFLTSLFMGMALHPQH